MRFAQTQKQNDHDRPQKDEQATYHRNTGIWLKFCGISI